MRHLLSGTAGLFVAVAVVACSSAPAEPEGASSEDNITVGRWTSQTPWVGKYEAISKTDALDILALDLRADGTYAAVVSKLEHCKAESCNETGKWKAEAVGRWVGAAVLDNGFRLTLEPTDSDARRYELGEEFSGGPIVVQKRKLKRRPCATNPCNADRPRCQDQDPGETSLCLKPE